MSISGGGGTKGTRGTKDLYSYRYRYRCPFLEGGGTKGTRGTKDVYSYRYRYRCPFLEGVELRELGELRMCIAIGIGIHFWREWN